MLIPALAGGEDVRIWPFAGAFRALLAPGAVALAETYPAEALRHLGIRLNGSKRRQADRAAVAAQLAAAMAALAVLPDPALRCDCNRRLRADAAGEDRFDCVLGVLCVLNVLAGNRPDTAPDDAWVRRWEGWVLGQTAMPTAWLAASAVAMVGAGMAGSGTAGKKKWRARKDAPKVVFGNETPLHELDDFDKSLYHAIVSKPMNRSFPDWKGLQTGQMPVFLGYDQTERMIAALLDRAAQWRPDAVVGIARGGLVPATMAAGIMALPLSMIGFERTAGATQWIGVAPAAGRVLLVDDGCSTGRTMDAVRAALLREGRDCLTLAVVHDPDVTSYVPDLSHPMRKLWRFPWERGEATPTGRALRATGAGPDRTTELPFYGLDLDGVFLPDVPDAVYHADILEAVNRRHGLEPFAKLPFFSPERAVVITGRPNSDHERTCTWLARWGHGALPRGMPAGRHAAHGGHRRPLQSGDRNALGMYAFRRERCGAGTPHRRPCAASGGELVVGKRRPRLADRCRSAAGVIPTLTESDPSFPLSWPGVSPPSTSSSYASASKPLVAGPGRRVPGQVGRTSRDARLLRTRDTARF